MQALHIIIRGCDTRNIFIVFIYKYFLRYAWTHIRNSVLSRFSRTRKWVTLTMNEMKGFLAVFLNMGIMRKPTIPEYWNKTHNSQLSRWLIKKFHRNRFQLILQFFHLVDNKKTPNRNSPPNFFYFKTHVNNNYSIGDHHPFKIEEGGCIAEMTNTYLFMQSIKYILIWITLCL